jgi:hypothetical protein
MNIGMLWFDNDPKVSLDIKVERAAVYYRNKYGRSPTLCYVHPTMLTIMAEEAAAENKRFTSTGVELRSHRSVLPNHFWIGLSAAAAAD